MLQELLSDKSTKIKLSYSDLLNQNLGNNIKEDRFEDIFKIFIKSDLKAENGKSEGFFSFSKFVPLVFQNPEDNRKDISLSLNFLKNLNESLTLQELSINYKISFSNELLKIKEFEVKTKDKCLVKFTFEGGKELKLEKVLSDFIPKGSFNSKILTNLRSIIHNKSLFDFFPDSNSILNKSKFSSFSILISKITNIALRELKSVFHEDNINYVSPLRAHPKRYYFLDKAKVHSHLDTLDGDAIAEILKDNSKLRNRVNSWIKRFDVSVDVSNLEDVIHRLVVSQGGLDLDITDVGFGLSQVLPVLIQGFLSKDFSTTIIEQPEIHLHPRAQADLGDLFIDMVTTSTNPRNRSETGIYKKLIIETHSEYLLKRIRRRISEGKLNHELVNIVNINRNDKTHESTIENIFPDEKGNFKYPKNFYSDELFDDTTIFLANQ